MGDFDVGWLVEAGGKSRGQATRPLFMPFDEAPPLDLLHSLGRSYDDSHRGPKLS